MNRALVGTALVVAALAAWLALRGCAATPSADAPAVAAKPERVAPRQRTRVTASQPLDTSVEETETAAPPESENATPVVEPNASADAPPAAVADPVNTTVVGRLVDEHGLPLAGFGDLVAGIVDVGATPRRLGRATTDERGRFRFVLARPSGVPKSPQLEVGRVVKDRHDVPTMSRIALVDLPSLFSGEVDVGDIVYRGTSLLVSGWVVDADAKPLSGVEVRAMKEIGKSRLPVDDIDAAVTDGDGAFTIRGEATSDSLVLGASLDGYCVAERASFGVGTTDARIVMTQAGGIAGSIRLPPEDSIAYVGVEGTPGDNGDTRFTNWGRRKSVVKSDGTFEIRNLRPGAGRVSLRLGINETVTVLSIDDVRVVAGQITRDPRLQDVDPSKTTSTLTIRPVDLEGVALRAAVYSRRAGADQPWDQEGDDSVVTIRRKREVLSGDGLDVLVLREGRRPVTVRGVHGDTKVVLEPSHAKTSTVRVRLAENSPQAAPTFRIDARLHWIEPDAAPAGIAWYDPRDARSGKETFDKDRVVTFEGVEPGRYRVVLKVWTSLMNSASADNLATSPKTVVVPVAGDGASVDVVVGIDADDFARQTKRSR